MGSQSRRRILKILGAAGAGSIAGRELLALAEEKGKITTEMIRRAEWISGLTFTDDDRTLMRPGLEEMVADWEKLRAIPLDNVVPPALRFDPCPWIAGSSAPRASVEATEGAAPRRPSTRTDLAFASVTELATLLRSRQVSSVELTRTYLERLRMLDPELLCVVTLTEELALRQAERADREIATGRWRGGLHGIPWGAKDLLAVPGYPTTWGATPYREQSRSEKATVAARLEEAGAVLVAKLSVGALAWGDVWYGGTTRNPWRPSQGSSGSSAGPASATAAGLVGFSVGTETWGSIVSPCTRCGVTGLRPTYGRVSRHGTMALSWSMDKIGPIARSVEDCALVFAAIQGPDGLDPTVVDRPFVWPFRGDVRRLRIGFAESLFEEDRTKQAENEDEKAGMREWQENDHRTIETLRDLGIEPIPIRLPDRLPVGPLALILTAEAATAFDELPRTGRDDLLERQVADAWPNVFRQGQLIPAVEYIRANRIRTLLMAEMERLMANLDAYVAPSFGGDNLLLTNLTGHPQVVVPNGFRSSDGTPTSITFTGKLHGETELLALARAYQEATEFHLRRPPIATR